MLFNIFFNLQEYFVAIDGEDADFADAADLAGVEQLDVAGAGGEIVAERDAVLQMEDFAVSFPNEDVERLPAVEHSASGLEVDGGAHLKT